MVFIDHVRINLKPKSVAKHSGGVSKSLTGDGEGNLGH